MKKTLIFAGLMSFVGIYGACTTSENNFDKELGNFLKANAFDGKIQTQLEHRLGRKLDSNKIELGKLIFFDAGLGLHSDNSCAGCHAPNFGFGDSQPIAIGIQNNDIVGESRTGPRNQRHTPSVINTAFYPALMWNGRFASNAGDPFRNDEGFLFPSPEEVVFAKGLPYTKQMKHLLVAQAHIPFTEQPEMAGFTTSTKENTFASFSRFMTASANKNGILQADSKPLLFTKSKSFKRENFTEECMNIDFSQFNDGKGTIVPQPDPTLNSANFRIRDIVLNKINEIPEYKQRFADIYDDVKQGKPITFLMIGEVLAEFQMSLTFAQSPLDAYANGDLDALNESQKKGAIIFFGKGKCVQCHSVKGNSNQMFSDFASHNIGVPQIYPKFGKGTGNVPFSDFNDPDCKSDTGTLDLGLADFTTKVDDRFKFRSSPLRNLKLQSSFFHNGSFNSLEKAMNYHLNPKKEIEKYDLKDNGAPANLINYRKRDMDLVMKTLDPILKNGITLSNSELTDLVEFLKEGLYDKRATKELLVGMIPKGVPSKARLPIFQ